MLTVQTIPVVDLADYRAGGERRERFVSGVGSALAEVGFFALDNHGIDPELTARAYEVARAFFALSLDAKTRCESPGSAGQRGYTPYGRERAKDQTAPDLKEFFQVGRVDVPDDHPVNAVDGPNVWPDDELPAMKSVLGELYVALDELAAILLQACALHVGEPAELFSDMVHHGNTIIRVLHYPPITGPVPAGAVRAAAHEDINFITLLSGATAEGLELLTREGEWLPIRARHDHLIVDSGDMLQNLTNGYFRATTHRVVNPENDTRERYSMPCFVHPRGEVDLTPLPSCIERTGGEARFPATTAAELLDQRLRAIGLTRA
jgi:isopenicillin N synthase-like dioxygenase